MAIVVFCLGSLFQATAAEQPHDLKFDLGKGVSIKLVLIPAGKFIMGSPETEPHHDINEGPQHEVTISKPFYMSIYPVTQAQYEAVMGLNPEKNPVPNGIKISVF